MDQRPDLAVLESVETKAQSILPMLLIMSLYTLAFPVLAAWSYLRLREYIGTGPTALIGLTLTLSLWVVLRALSGYYYYKTDPKGITVRGPLRRRYISWIEVNDACTKETTSETIVVLKTNNGTITLAPRSIGGPSGELVIASAWQHLRRVGRVGQIELPCSTHSLWDTIPDDLPRDMDWSIPEPKGEYAGLAIIVLMFGGLLGCLLWDSSGGMLIAALLPAAMVVCLFRLLIPTVMRKAYSASLSGDNLAVRLPMKSTSLPLSEVTAAQWVNDGLLIRAGAARKEIIVPWLSKDDGSCRLLLAMIRQLRNAGLPQAVTIPDSLRAPSPVAADSIAELHWSRAEMRFFKWSLGSLGGVVAIASAFGPRHDLVSSGVVVVLTAAWFLLADRVTGSYYRQVDSECYTSSFLGVRRTIKWADVAEAEFSPLGGRVRLKNSKGRLLTEISTGIGRSEERSRFIAALRARLGHTEAEAKPWLARSWTPPDPN